MDRTRPPSRPARLAFATGLLLLAAVSPAAAQDTPIRLSEAAAFGAFNVGTATASAGRTADPATGGDALALDYRLPPGTAAGVWAKGFPRPPRPDAAEIVRLDARAATPGQAPALAATIEIKGTAGVQRVPVEFGPNGALGETALDWPAIGELTEVVVVFNNPGDSEAAGRVVLALQFERLAPLRRLSTHPAARVGGVLLFGLLAAGLLAALRAVAGGRRPQPTDDADRLPGVPRTEPVGLRRDFVLGVGVVAVAALVVGVYHLGARGPLEIGWTALAVAAVGVALAEWLKFGLTGRHLSPGDLFRGAIGSGLPATSASPLPLLQAPAAWPDVLLLSATAAAGLALAYQVASLYRLAVAGRPLGPVAAGLILGTPYVLGSLLLLRSDGLIRTLGEHLTVGSTEAYPAVAAAFGRVVILFAFLAAAAHGLSLAAARRFLTSPLAHAWMLAVAVAAVVAPWVAAAGSGTTVAGWQPLPRYAAAVLATMLSQAGLWAAVYLVTGMVLDALGSRPPSADAIRGHAVAGARKGAVFSGVFMAVITVPAYLWNVAGVQWLAANATVPLLTVVGAAVFPLVKTVIETFDGSTAFFRRVGTSYRNPVLYFRGAVVGLGIGVGIVVALSHAPSPVRESFEGTSALANGVIALAHRSIPVRAAFGFAVGLVAFAGVNLVRDVLYARRGVGGPQPWRTYLVQGVLGGAIGAAIGFYLDAAQLAAVEAKYFRYLSLGSPPEPVDVRPLLSTWGRVDLGTVTGGPALLFTEAVAGVLEWSIAAWLFAVNRTVMLAYFRKESAPIRNLFTPGGLLDLGRNTIEVLRWGLWMSPIIKSFIRAMGEPTWYNQDGAVRSLWAVVQDLRLSPEAFDAWSLGVFVALMAYAPVRILIWLDHMGLRVATLVNLSFLGMDKLDGRLARFLAPAATARCIPEAVKRFTTWAPLLIPYYIPRGTDWDYAWETSQTLQREARHGGVVSDFLALPVAEQLAGLAAAAAGATAVFAAARGLRRWFGWTRRPDRSLSSSAYEVVMTPAGGLFSRVPNRGYDVSRRSYDGLDPAGRVLYLVDPAAAADAPGRCWPVAGHAAGGPLDAAQDDGGFVIRTDRHGLRTTVAIALAGGDAAEVWTVTVANATDAPRPVKLVPYLEWVLNRPDADRGHTQYNRLFAEMECSPALHAVVARDKHAKATGVLAADVRPDGFLTSRVDFLGRAGTVGRPRALETLAFAAAEGTDGHPTFDPVGSLLVGVTVPARGSVRVRFLIGMTHGKGDAIALIDRHLGVAGAKTAAAAWRRKPSHSVGHGEIPPGTPQPYSEFSPDGRRLTALTPFTPRPYDHALSNALGHVVAVTNRGLHTTSSVNSQQNRLTPDWADTVTRELPGEAFYLYDPDRAEWDSPTYHPLNDRRAAHRAEFGVDGTATFHMTRGDLATELTVFVPPDEPAGVYLLTVRNRSATARRLRVAPYFQMVLAGQPEQAGPLNARRDPALNAVFFTNPRNPYRTGPAFVAISQPADRVETVRGRFFGPAGDVARPAFVATGEPDASPTDDDRPVAAFLATLDLPPNGEATLVVVLGQADDMPQATAVVRRLCDEDAARAAVAKTRAWWLSLMDTVRVRTTDPAFDRYLLWLRYQALAERIWARRGFYQASGAFGFRDQLQDAVNLAWMDPTLARRQIVLHAGQQFLEGDVVHWFHRLQDGRTGLVGRTHASDNLLWLAWAVVDYLSATGDGTILDEQTTYLDADRPFEPLPAGKGGMGFDPLRSARSDTVYRHCLKSIDLVLDRRLGRHGLPLMGTGDWNDGLDEIGSEGRGESVWLGFFLYYILDRMAGVVGRREGAPREDYYRGRLRDLGTAIEATWRGDRYLRAFHDDGTEIGLKSSGVWEIDALTASWAVMANVNPDRGRTVFDTALTVLEKDTTILLGWPPLREDSTPYLGRSSAYPEGVRENGMYSHGVQWLVGAARLLAEQRERSGDADGAAGYRATAYRLWLKVSPLPHVTPDEIETYGGQPNKQAADMVTSFDPGRMIWHGYTGAAGWMFRQAIEGVLGLRLDGGMVVPPAGLPPAGDLRLSHFTRDVADSPLGGSAALRPAAATVSSP